MNIWQPGFVNLGWDCFLLLNLLWWSDDVGVEVYSTTNQSDEDGDDGQEAWVKDRDGLVDQVQLEWIGHDSLDFTLVLDVQQWQNVVSTLSQVHVDLVS